MPFCLNCGTQLPEGAKFCGKCGTPVGSVSNELDQSQTKGPSEYPRQTIATDDTVEEVAARPATFTRNELGRKLEDNVALIFQSEGYQTQLRKQFKGEAYAGGAEIDIILIMGKRRKAVECKNYDISREVAIKELRDFKTKLEQIGIVSGVFVTTTSFSQPARDFAEQYGIDLWDRSILYEKFASYMTGRGSVQFAKTIQALPVTLDFASASSILIRNNQSLRLFKTVLLYHPYHLLKYRVHAVRKDPTGKNHKIADEGTVIVDGLDGDVTNREETITQSLTGLLSRKEKRAERKEDKAVAKDLLSLQARNESLLRNADYEVRALDTEVTEEEARRTGVQHVIEKDTETVEYEPRGSKDELFSDTRSMKVVPKASEITIRGQTIVHVPKWDLQFESGQWDYQRRFLASSGTVMVDELAKCMKCTLLRRSTSAVCDVCGIALCDKHTHEEGGGLLCEDHISDALRQQIKGKGIFSRFKLGGDKSQTDT